MADSVQAFQDRLLVQAFRDGPMTHVLRGATPAEVAKIRATVSPSDAYTTCTLLNNAAFAWLWQAQESERIHPVDANLRVMMLNAFFYVNFESAH
jgi:hypothetical protein